MGDPKISEVARIISTIDLTGNIIPHTWFQNALLKYPNGKVNLNAVVVLSDIIYWYRLIEDRDERTGKIIGYRQKFKADKLQKYYEPWGENFGLTKRQMTEALTFLRQKKIITIEFRTIIGDRGMKVANVPFIEPAPDRIKELCIPYHTKTGHPPITLKRDTHPTPERDTPVPLKRETNTDITSTHTPPLPPPDDGEDNREKIIARLQQWYPSARWLKNIPTQQMDYLLWLTESGKRDVGDPVGFARHAEIRHDFPTFSKREALVQAEFEEKHQKKQNREKEPMPLDVKKFIEQL